MLEMQATIGRIQLRRMVDWTKKRNFNAYLLEQAFKAVSHVDGAIRAPFFGCSSSCTATEGRNCKSSCLHAYYKYYVYLRPQGLAPGWSRDRIIEAINAEGVPCFQGSCSEVYLEKAFDNTGWRPTAPLPVARELGENSLMFLVHPTLTDEEMQKSADVIRHVLTNASKVKKEASVL
jgi:dTDP-4-amino-4,6-dideoxygalactose transaminase